MEKETATIEEVQTPKADWNTEALLEATKPGMPHRKEATELCVERLRGITENASAFVVISDDGHWGRGDSLQSAAETCVKAGARKSAQAFTYLVQNDSKPELSDYGVLICNSNGCITRLGGIKTVGALIAKK